MKRLKLFFACLLMAVLSIGQVWGAVGDTYTQITGKLSKGTHEVLIAVGDYNTSNSATSGSSYIASDKTTGTYISLSAVTFGGSAGAYTYVCTDAKQIYTIVVDANGDITSAKSSDNTYFSPSTSSNKLLTDEAGMDVEVSGNCYKWSKTSGSNTYYVCSQYSYNLRAYKGKCGNAKYCCDLILLEKASTPSCTKTVSVAKTTPVNGGFEISATEVCGDGTGGEVSITNIEPATGYELDDITATVGTVDKVNNKVTGITGNTSITVTFKEKQKYTVTLMDDTQNPLVEASAGAGVTLPGRDGCTGYTFAGWTKDWTAAQTSWTTTAPEIIEAGTYHPTANVSLYPVYTKAEGTAESWTPVTSAPDDWSGEYVIVNTDNTYAMSSDFYATGEFKGESVTITNNKVVSPTNKMIWTIAKNGSEAQYSLLNKATGTYASITANNTTKAGLSETAVWFTIGENATAGVWDIISVTYTGRCFSFYTQNSSFRTYAPSSNNTGRLYKKSGGQTTSYISEPNCATPDVIVKTLKSIAVSGMTTNYETGNTFSFDGTCTATYSVTVNDVQQADEEKTVTPTEVTSPDMSTAGVKTITVSFTDGVTKSTSYDITVVKASDVTLDFLDGNWSFPTSYQTTEEEFTNSVTSYAVTCKGTGSNGYKITSDYLMLGKQYAYIILPEFSNPVEKIVFVKGNGDNPSGNVLFNIFDGDDAVSTQVKGCDANKEFIIVNPAANKQYTLKVTSDHNLQIGGLKIYFGEAPAVAQPTITGNAAFVGSQDVTITCATTGAAIYYTTDATKKDDPSTTEWSTYGTKVTLNASCTLYAAATTDGGTTWSAVASKEFTATPLYTSIEALQGVATSDEATVFVQMTNWVVTATTNIYAYVTDGSGKGMIFFKNGHNFAIGDKLNKAQLQTTLQNYNGTYELKNLTTADFAGEGELVHGATIPAIAKTATEYAALTNANQGVLYVVNNLTYDATNGKFIDDDANEIAYYNKFNIDESALVDGHKYNVTGVAVYYKPGEGDPVVQLCPRTADDLYELTEYVQISFDANAGTAAYTGTLPTTITDHIKGQDYTVPAASLARTDGYYQLGWNTDAAATTALTSLTAVAADQVLYAIWKATENCTISFYSKGQLYDTKVKAQNAAYDFNDVVAPTAQGWTFYGWSESEIATEEASATILDSYTPTSSTKSLYAVFKRTVDGEPVTQYEKVTTAPSNWAGNYLLVYENSATQGHVWDGTDASSNYKTAGIASGVISTKPTDAALLTIAAYSTGHSILINGGTNDGKYLKGNGKNTALLFGDDADVVTISCESNGTELLFTQRSIRYMDGRFRYYSDEKALGWLYRENTVTPQSDVYTTAPVVRYNITFVLASGEEGTFNPISVEEGESATLPTSVPTKLHNTFLKWSDGVNEYAAGATITNVQADIELHATWDPESPATVSFNLNGASGSIDAIENLYGGDPYQLPAAPAYDDEHAFAGWSDGVNVYTAEAAMTMTSPAADVEYVAQWDAVEVSDYALVTDLAQLQAGDKIIIVAANYNVAAGSQAATYRNPVTIGKTASKNNLILAGYGTPTEFTLGIPTAGEYTFNDGDGYMYESAAKSIKVREDSYSWSISIDGEAIATIRGTNALQYNAASGQERFTTYASSQQALQLYRKPGTAPEPTYTEVRNGLTEGWYYTMCLDKAVTAVKAGSIWKVLSKAANGKDVILEEAELPLVAGRPYIFRAAASTLEVAYSGDAVDDPVDDEDNNGLVGSFTGGPIAQSPNNYIIWDNALYVVNSGNVYVGAHRAYLDMTGVPGYNNEPQQGNAPRRRVVMTVHGEQNATGMENVQGDNVHCTKVLIDGQMYILRGEKMYDAKGQLVK